ncbi:MAG: hypothetical protein RLZZ165_2326 [Bacteroidota bacterium]|jgi:predicted RNA-binding protein (virulence factor B family)
MMNIGKWNALEVVGDTKFGLYLADEEGNEVLLPNKYCPKDAKIGDKLDVFVYRDAQQRPVATTLRPLIIRDSFAYLKVKQVGTIGAFLDWGLEKDLLAPYREQDPRMEEGRRYMVYLYLDPVSGRLVCTNRIRRHLSNDQIDFEVGDEVFLQVWEQTEIGFRAIVNNRHIGMVFRTDLHEPLHIGDKMKGYIRSIREDNKIDLSLHPIGFENVETQAELLLEHLRKCGGHLPYGDKSNPEAIQKHLKMSKKTFKRAAGMLLKRNLVRIEEEAIFLLQEPGTRS